MMQVTDEMVEAVWNHNKGSALITKQTPFAQIDDEWRQQIREVLEAALAVAPAPVAGDAKFEAALDEWFNAESAANWYRRNGLVGHFTADERAEAEARWELVIAEAESTRQRVLALHAAARNAGLRELRAELVARKERIVADDPERSPHSDLAFGVYLEEHEYILEQIDAMLKGGAR